MSAEARCTARDGYGQGVRCELSVGHDGSHACPEALGAFERDSRGRVASGASERPVLQRAVAVELERIEELANWAAEDGDPDVLALCEAAFVGDVAAWSEALEWWASWARTHAGAA